MNRYEGLRMFGDMLKDIQKYLNEKELDRFAPFPGDSLYIGDTDNDTPVYIEIEPETPVYMGEVHGQSIYTT